MIEPLEFKMAKSTKKAIWIMALCGIILDVYLALGQPDVIAAVLFVVFAASSIAALVMIQVNHRRDHRKIDQHVAQLRKELNI